MTITYQPSAAGISWLTLSQTLASRAQMEKDLLALSSANSKVQISMTENSSDQTLKELKAAAEGQKQGAYFTLAGSVLGAVASGGTYFGVIKGMPQEETPTSTVTSSIKLEDEAEVEEPTNSLKLEEMETPEIGSAQVVGQNESSSQAPASPAKETAADAKKENTPSSQQTTLSRYFTEHGSILSQFTNTSITSLGNIQQAKYTAIQAEEKSLEVIAQGLASVMGAQGGMLSSAIGSSDASFNNTESAITTITQVSAIRA